MSRTQHLRSLLGAFAPVDAREHAHKQRLLQLLSECPEPFSRAEFAPGHVTASAFILNQARDSVLLILHAKLRLWLQPGGHVELTDEDVLSAAQREVREEVGLDDLLLLPPGLFDVDVHRIPPHGSQPAHEHFDVRFLFTAQNTAAVAGSDADAVRWVRVAELLHAGPHGDSSARSFPSDESVLRALRKITAWSA
jgi:8-oxo-dGTP pyrophosphatase MutT (NUDIX family)